MSTHKQETLLERIETWLRNKLFFSILILLGVTIISTGEIVEKGSDILVALHVKQEKTLQLATETAKGELSRRLTELAWRRLFWTNNYLERVRLKRPPGELEYSWAKHLDTVADWSAEYIVNLNGMEQFYPAGTKANQFQAIHEQFRNLENDLLVPLRMHDSDKSDHSAEIAKSKTAVDKLNVDLYFFVLNKSQPGFVR